LKFVIDFKTRKIFKQKGHQPSMQGP